MGTLQLMSSPVSCNITFLDILLHDAAHLIQNFFVVNRSGPEDQCLLRHLNEQLNFFLLNTNINTKQNITQNTKFPYQGFIITDIIRLVKSRRLGWVEQINTHGKQKMHIKCWKEERDHLIDLAIVGEYMIKMSVKEIVWEGGD